MAAILFKSDILFLQRIMAVSGFYRGPLDGKWNATLDAADDAFADKTAEIKAANGAFDPRSETAIATLIPAAQLKARALLAATATLPYSYKILSGTRTYAEQNELYAIGRTKELSRRPVTKARGGQSNHNFGIAWDIGIFEAGKYFTGANKKENAAYAALGATIRSKVPGVAWGGDWTSFPDTPHYELKTGKGVSELRALLEAGTPYA